MRRRRRRQHQQKKEKRRCTCTFQSTDTQQQPLGSCARECQPQVPVQQGGTLDLLCPDTVQDDRQTTMFVHRAFKSRDILVQCNFGLYVKLLCFKAAGLAEFHVMCTGHAMFGECEECVCSLWKGQTSGLARGFLFTYRQTGSSTTPETSCNESNIVA